MADTAIPSSNPSSYSLRCSSIKFSSRSFQVLTWSSKIILTHVLLLVNNSMPWQLLRPAERAATRATGPPLRATLLRMRKEKDNISLVSLRLYNNTAIGTLPYNLYPQLQCLRCRGWLGRLCGDIRGIGSELPETGRVICQHLDGAQDGRWNHLLVQLQHRCLPGLL